MSWHWKTWNHCCTFSFKNGAMTTSVKHKYVLHNIKKARRVYFLEFCFFLKESLIPSVTNCSQQNASAREVGHSCLRTFDEESHVAGRVLSPLQSSLAAWLGNCNDVQEFSSHTKLTKEVFLYEYQGSNGNGTSTWISNIAQKKVVRISGASCKDLRLFHNVAKLFWLKPVKKSTKAL